MARRRLLLATIALSCLVILISTLCFSSPSSAVLAATVKADKATLAKATAQAAKKRQQQQQQPPQRRKVTPSAAAGERTPTDRSAHSQPSLKLKGQKHQDRTIELNRDSFQEAVRGAEHAAVAFYAPWQSKSKQLLLELSKVSRVLAKQKSPWQIFKVDHLKNKGIGEQYAVTSLPTIVFFEPESTNATAAIDGVVRSRSLLECLEAVASSTDEASSCTLLRKLPVRMMPSAEGIQEALNALVPRNYTHDVRIAPQSATPEELRAYTEFKRQRVRGGLGEKGQAFTDRHDETLDSAHPHRSPPPWKLSELTKQHIHKHAPTSHDSVEQAIAAEHEFEPIDGRLPRLYDGPYFNAEGGGRMLAPSQLDVDLEMHQVLMAEVRAGSTRISPATRARVLKRDKELRLEALNRKAKREQRGNEKPGMRPLTLPDGRKPFTKIHSVPTQDEAESLLLDGTGKPVDCGEFGTLAGARNFAPGQVKKWTGVERIFIPGNGVEGNFAGDGTWYNAVVMRVGADGSFDLEYEAGGREREVPAPWVRQRFASSWPPPPVDDDGLPIVVVDTTTTTTTASTDSVEQVADSIPVLPSSAEKSPSREVETNAQPQSLKASPVVGDLPSPTHIEVVGQRFREPVGDNRRVDSLRNALATAKLSHYYEPLAELGAVEVEDLFELVEEDFNDVGMKRLETKRLLRYLASLRHADL